MLQVNKNLKITLYALGIISLILGVLSFFNPFSTLQVIVILLGIGAFLSAFFNLTLVFGVGISTGYKVLKVIEAIFWFFLAVAFFSMPTFSEEFVGYMFAFWFIFSSAELFAGGLIFPFQKTWVKIFDIIFGLLGLFLGFTLLFTPAASVGTFLWLVAFWLIIIGITDIFWASELETTD